MGRKKKPKIIHPTIHIFIKYNLNKKDSGLHSPSLIYITVACIIELS